MTNKTGIPLEVEEMLNVIINKFESKFNVNEEDIFYDKGEIGFGYKNKSHDFEISFNIFRKNFIIVIDFWKTGQQRIDVQYEEENKGWYLYSYAVNWEEQLETIKPFEISFLDKIIDNFFSNIDK